MQQVHAYSSENSTRFLTELTSIYIEKNNGKSSNENYVLLRWFKIKW